MTTTFILAPKPGQNDYANCQGEYQKSLGTLNGRSVWFNNPKKRVIFYNRCNWTINTTKSMENLLEGDSKGFYFSQDAPKEPYQANFSPRYCVQSE